MSEAIMQLVEEFFCQRKFFVSRDDNLILARNVNPKPGRQGGDADFLLDEENLPFISNAVVRPVGWHTQRITAGALEKAPEILSFLKSENIARIRQIFQGEDFEKILVLPHLPYHASLAEKAVEKLKNSGIDRVILFADLVSCVIKNIEPRRIYSSSVCETLRILKHYGFLSSEQLVLPLHKKNAGS